MRHGGREGIDLHRTLAQRRQAGEVLRIDVIGKDKHRCPLVTDDGHDIGLAEFVVHEPTVSGLLLARCVDTSA